MIHIALDLETWGTSPGHDLRSIGARVFDPMTGTVGVPSPVEPIQGASPITACFTPGAFFIAVENPAYTVAGTDDGTGVRRQYPLKRDPDTVLWWAHPDRLEATRQFAAPVPLEDGLTSFADWLFNLSHDPCEPEGGSREVRIWGHGASFDPPFLAHVYEVCGLPVPWHYRAPRDTRTISDAAAIIDPLFDINAYMRDNQIGTYHHALDDATTEAFAICEAYRYVIDAARYKP